MPSCSARSRFDGNRSSAGRLPDKMAFLKPAYTCRKSGSPFSKSGIANSIRKWLFENTTLCLILIGVVKQMFAGKLQSTADHTHGGLKDHKYEEDVEFGSEWQKNFSFKLARWVLTSNR